MSRLELKVPPPAVLAAVGLLMWAVAALSGPPRLPRAWRVSAATILAVGGAAIGLVAVGSFRGARTTVHPTRPEHSSALVTTGIYRRTRNPMYLALLLALLAFAALLGKVRSHALSAVIVLYIDRFQIGPEERVLRSLFGEEFERYCERVRRWI